MFFGALRTLFFSLLVISFAGCSEYSKVLKSDDAAYKLEMANRYYEKNEVNRALPLYEELIALYRGTGKSEQIYFNYASCYYKIEDYYQAGYYFKNFYKTYPSSPLSEEAMYLSANCAYRTSPIHSLDQSDTYTAINEFQLFLDRYPETEKKDRVNDVITELRNKLEMKAYENAKLYYTTENYKSAVIALKNVLRNFPTSPHKEEIDFLIVKSNYLLAVNSTEDKKEERLNETIDSYFKFLDYYKESKYLKEAESLYGNALKELDKVNNVTRQDA